MLVLSCSISQLPTQTSLSNIQSKQTPRFRRSCSGGRSRSKEHLANAIHETGHFIKNICSRVGSRAGEEEKKERMAPREGTPAKENRRTNLHMPEKKESGLKNTALARRCEQLAQLLEKSQSYIYELQSRIASLERKKDEKDESSRQNASEKQEKRSNKDSLAKMRKLISEAKTAEIIPAEYLAIQLKMLQAQNLCLRDKNSQLLQQIRQKSDEVGRVHSEQEKQLLTCIKELKISLQQREKQAEKLRIELRMIKLKQNKQDQNREVIKNEEVAYLKFRYENLRKKFQEVNRELKKQEQKEKKCVRASYLFGEQKEQEATHDFSLSLSP